MCTRLEEKTRKAHNSLNLGVMWQHNEGSAAANRCLEKKKTKFSDGGGEADGAGSRASGGRPYVRGS